MIRRVLNGLLVLFGIYVAWIIVLWFMQDGLVFPRAWATAYAHEFDRPGVDVMWIESEAGPMPAWFFKGTGVSDQSPTGAVVMLHGNAMCIGDWFDEAAGLAATGVNVLLPEYRGYGNAPGSPTQKAITEDVVAFVDALKERDEVRGDRIVYYGRSIGSAVAVQVALRRPPAGMILHTPPTSIARFAMRYGAPPFLIRNPFRTDHALPRLKDVPILIVSHDADTLVESAQSRRLVALAPHAEFLEVGGTHNTFSTRADEATFREARLEFLGRFTR